MKKPKSMSFLDQGLYYGYPPCCISEFIQFVVSFTCGFPDKRGKRKLHGSGYVPCIICNDKSTEELLAYIETNRQCEKPFTKRRK